MRRATLLTVGLLACCAGGAAAQTPPVDLSPFYHALAAGVGARAWGMGGAQLALSDEAEAATWNPAALSGRDRPAALVIVSGDRLTGDGEPVRYTLGSGPSGSILPGSVTASGSRLQALQFAVPLPVWGRRLVAGLEYRRRFSPPVTTGADYQFHHQSLYRFDYDYQYEAEGTRGFDTFGASVSARLGGGITAGVTIQRWFGSAGSSYRESYRYSVADYYGWTGTWNETLGDELLLEVSGFSVDAGAQVSAGSRFSAGIVFRSAADADVSYANAATHEDTHLSRQAAARHSGSGSLTLPSSLGFGVAVRPLSRLTLAADYTRVFWAGAAIDGYARVTALGDVPAPARFAFPTQAPVALGTQSDAGRFSAGAEYRVTAGRIAIPLRAGVFHQQAYDGRGGSSVAATAGAGLRWRGLLLDAAWVRETASGRYTRQSFTSSLGWAF